jgi:glycosyltransferase involved in cell wall biosynthesis
MAAEPDRPTVSVGLPVYNGERYLEESIDSILAQSFTDFELIISDNASTDRTEGICRRYAAADARVRYHRNERNIGGAPNHRRVFSLARGRYFRWAAHDDVCDRQLLARCVEVLERCPEAVLSYPFIVQIDENGSPIGEVREQRGTSPVAHMRFRDAAAWDHDCAMIYGLIRADVLVDIESKTGLMLPYATADRTLLGQLGLYGRFCQIDQPLFYKRYHPEMSIRVYPGWRDLMLWSSPAGGRSITFPYWQELLHQLRAINTAPVSRGERWRCYVHILESLPVDRRWGKLLKDLYCAGLLLLQSATHRGVHEKIAAD